MKMERIEAASEVLAPRGVVPLLPTPVAPESAHGPAAAFVGILLLCVALPCWAVGAAARLIWRDLRRVGRVAGLFGGFYLEALRRPR